MNCAHESNLRNPAVSSSHLLKMIVRLLKRIQLLHAMLASVWWWTSSRGYVSRRDWPSGERRDLRNIKCRMKLHDLIVPCGRSREAHIPMKLHLQNTSVGLSRMTISDYYTQVSHLDAFNNKVRALLQPAITTSIPIDTGALTVDLSTLTTSQSVTSIRTFSTIVGVNRCPLRATSRRETTSLITHPWM